MSKRLIRRIAGVALGSLAMFAVATAPLGCASTRGCGGCTKSVKRCPKGCTKPCCKKKQKKTT